MPDIKRTTGEKIGVSIEGLGTIVISELDLYRADFSGLSIEKLSFDGVVMRNAEFRGVDVTECSFDNTNSILASFRGAALLNCKFVGARLRYADFSGAG